MTSELITELQKVDLKLKPDALCFLTTSKDDDRTVPLSVPLPLSEVPERASASGPAVPVSETVAVDARPVPVSETVAVDARLGSTSSSVPGSEPVDSVAQGH
eukprot:12753787-Alexandrium_andersonii.AAC.1